MNVPIVRDTVAEHFVDEFEKFLKTCVLEIAHHNTQCS